MILTLTPNPSVDRTISLASLERGAVQRATGTRMDPGGKGVNVSRALAGHGERTLAVLPVGGPHGRVMEALLAETGTPVSTVPVAEGIRANVTLVEPDGTTTKINEPGPRLTDAEIEALLDAVEAPFAGDSRAAGAPSWVVGSGSLPPGAPADVYGRLTKRVHAAGAKVAVDSSGEALCAALSAGPDLLKPNREELGDLVGSALTTLGAVVEAARTVIAGGVGELLVSLGRDGAVLVTADSALFASASVERPRSTVAAGDCALAGFLLARERGEAPEQALATAVAFGAAAVALPGSEAPGPRQVAAVSVHVRALDPALVLSD